eukprot:2874841-Karenia_brevis.AAC.1
MLKLGSGDKRLEYENVRSYVPSLAQQRASSMTPKPSEVLGVEGQEEVPVEQEKYSGDEWMSWMWDIQVGAIQNPSIQCWVCGQMGHMGRNCPSKGKGKGDLPT